MHATTVAPRLPRPTGRTQPGLPQLSEWFHWSAKFGGVDVVFRVGELSKIPEGDRGDLEAAYTSAAKVSFCHASLRGSETPSWTFTLAPPNSQVIVMILKTSTGLAFAAACLTAIVTMPANADTARQNVVQSERYDRLLETNRAFRQARMRKECGPVTDPQLHQQCLAYFARDIARQGF
jgi:hypothetical protein